MELITAHERPAVEFVDILRERHKNSDFMWVSREFQWTKAFKRNKELKNPIFLQAEVLKSPRILQLIKEEAREKNLTEKQVQSTVKSILKEVGCSKELSVVRWLGFILLKIMKQTVTALYVNEDKLLCLKEQMGDKPLLFLPSHRSYADFILMAFVAFHYSIDIPCVAAGMDFHSMWLMGRLLRDCSAFFMRRSFAGDKLYRTVFDEYVKKLICLGEAPVEFFIEGTRSRSGKSLMPKLGLLTMVLETFYSGEVPDITVVPVSITYDRTLEEALFAYEMLGIAKPKESTSGLIKGIHMLDERYGQVHINFCDPISIHDYVWEASGRDFSYISRNLLREQKQITHLAHTIIDSQQKHAVLSCFNVLALLLSNHLATSRNPLSLSTAAKDVSWLSGILSLLGAYVKQADDSVESVKQAMVVHKSLVKLTEDNHIHLVSVYSPNVHLDPARIKGHHLQDVTMSLAVPTVMLQHYVNPCLHLIVNPAIISVIMNLGGDTGQTLRGDLFKRYKFLRLLLAHEFALYEKWDDKDFDNALVNLKLLNVIESNADDLLIFSSHRKLQLLMCNMLYPFLSGYLSLSQCILQMEKELLSEKALVVSCQRKIEADLLSGVLGNSYLLSLDSISCAISSLTLLQALQRLRVNGTVKYRVNHETLENVVKELGDLVVRPPLIGAPVTQISEDDLLDSSLRAKL